MRPGLSRPGVLFLAASLVSGGCSSQPKNPPDNPPSATLADLVDWRNALQMLREGRPDEAMQLLLHARQAYPSDPNIPNAMGLALVYKTDYVGAIRAFDEALRLDPGFVESHNNRGVALIELGRLDEAEADFRAVLDGPPSSEKANAHYNMGLVSKKREDWKGAESEFSLALSESPQNVRAYRERGLARANLEDFHAALEDFLKVLKAEPKDPVSNYQAALCLLADAQGRDESTRAKLRELALRYMERTVAAAPESDEGRKARRFLDAEPVTPRPPSTMR